MLLVHVGLLQFSKEWQYYFSATYLLRTGPRTINIISIPCFQVLNIRINYYFCHILILYSFAGLLVSDVGRSVSLAGLLVHM